jgi:predicted acylesterase/phospholipase RssA
MIDARVWVLSKKDFDELIATRPGIAMEMLREVSQRLVTTTRSTRREARRRITALAGSSRVVELAQALFAQLRTPVGLMPLPGSSMSGHVTISGGLMFLGQPNLTEASLAESLGYQVQVYKHIILLLPEEPDALARKAMDLADTLVSVGPPPAWFPTGTDKDIWETSGTQEDLGRIARRLTNRTIGLALSSGGSRGLAHIGVLKVLLEEKIPIDMVAGTSAGAWFGAFFAAGWSVEQFEHFAQEIRTFNRFPNWDFNIPPRTAILKGRKARDKIIDRLLEGRSFADLQVPLYIVAADILTGEEVIFNSGSVADAVRASLSVPVLVDPWHYQDRYLVDGGIVNPLPASLLRDRGADIVIASSVIQPLRESYGGRMDQMPNVLQIVFNIFSAMEAEVVKKQTPFIDVLIHHKVSAKHTLDFDQANALVWLGEESARRKLPEIKAAISSNRNDGG